MMSDCGKLSGLKSPSEQLLSSESLSNDLKGLGIRLSSTTDISNITYIVARLSCHRSRMQPSI